MEIVTSKLYGRKGKKLASLRKKDPARNLEERWKHLLEKYPDFERRYGFVNFVLDPGWAVVAVPEDKVAYTVGLHYRFGQKELLVSAPHLSAVDQKKLLNELARRVIVEGERFDDKSRAKLDDGSTLTFRAYEDKTFEKYPCGYLARFEELFEDRFHTRGGTLPILWAVLKPRARA